MVELLIAWFLSCFGLALSGILFCRLQGYEFKPLNANTYIYLAVGSLFTATQLVNVYERLC